MQFAKDKRSGAELSAKKAIAGRDYACPTCGEDVYVRGGIIRARHFAHRSGRADPDCENYHPGSAIRNPLTPQGGRHGGFVGDHGIRIDPLVLGLRVEPLPSVTRGDRQRWRLVMTLPKSLAGFGRLRVPTGFGAQSREVRLFSLSQGAQDIDVNPNAPRFGPEWVSDEVDHDYREVVSGRLDGFAQDYAQAFAASAAKLKPLASCFVWGDSYYIIWKRVDLIIPEILSAQLLAAYEGWSAAFIALPTAPDNEIANWLERFFRLPIQEAKRQWGIVYPPPIDVDLDGNISVSEAQCVVLGFVETEDSDGEASTLSVATMATHHEVLTKAGANSLFQVTRDAIDSREPLTLQWGPKYLPSIVAAQISGTTLPLPAVMIRIRDLKSDHDMRLFYHRPEARHALDRLRQGQAELVAISLPRGAVGLLEQRRNGGQWQQVLTLDDGSDGSRHGGAWSLSATHLAAILSALVDVDSDVRLSFGVFGQYAAFARRRHAIARTRLSPDTRRRIIWYCRANGLGHADSKRVIDLSTNKELLEMFGGSSPRPHLIAHRNLLTKRLRIEGSERTVR